MTTLAEYNLYHGKVAVKARGEKLYLAKYLHLFISILTLATPTYPSPMSIFLFFDTLAIFFYLTLATPTYQTTPLSISLLESLYHLFDIHPRPSNPKRLPCLILFSTFCLISILGPNTPYLQNDSLVYFSSLFIFYLISILAPVTPTYQKTPMT